MPQLDTVAATGVKAYPTKTEDDNNCSSRFILTPCEARHFRGTGNSTAMIAQTSLPSSDFESDAVIFEGARLTYSEYLGLPPAPESRRLIDAYSHTVSHDMFFFERQLSGGNQKVDATRQIISDVDKFYVCARPNNGNR